MNSARRRSPGAPAPIAFLGIFGLALAVGCGKDGGVAGVLVVSTVEVAPPSGSVIQGQSLQLTAIPRTEGGIVLPVRDLVWSSTNETTATVSSDGLVQAVSIGGPVRVRATMGGVTGETQITVLPVPVDRVVVTPPSAGILVGQSIQLTASAFDASGNPLTGRAIAWATGDPAIAAVTTTGLTIGLLEGGPVAITAVSEGKAGSSSVTVSRRPATRLGFVQQPGTATAGAAITPAVQVAVQDDLLGTVSGAVNAVTIALGSNPGAATLSGTRTVAAVNGVATFPNLMLNRAGTGYTLVATAQGLTAATSAAFNVTAGAATQLGFTITPPATAKSGVAFPASPVVQLRDPSGNAVPTPGIVITASVAPAGGSLGGTATATTNASGAATFTGLMISGPVGAYTISFVAPGLAPLTSGPIALSAGNPATLSIITQPAATGQSGVPLSRQPMLRLIDGAGNPVFQSGVLVSAAIATSPAGGALGGNTTASTDGSGIATFTNLALSGPAGSYTLRFSSTGLPAVTSTSIALGAGSGSILTVSSQPSSPVANGQTFPQQPAIQLRDAAGNPVGQSGVQISVSIQSGAGVLSGTTIVTTNGSGTGTFTNLRITGATGTRTLLFAAAGYVSVASAPVVVTAGPPNRLVIAVQPSATAQYGVPFPTQPAVQLQDVSGNPVNQAGVIVSAAVTPATATLGGTATATTNASGRATFTGLSLTGIVGSYRLVFSSTGLTGATSGFIALAAGPATKLIITTQPAATATSGTPLTTQPVVQLQDASGNPVSQAGVVVSAAVIPTSATLGGTATAISNASGRATFTGLSLTGKVGSYQLVFSSTGLTGATSGFIALAAGPATQLVITTQPAATATSGTPLTTQPVVQAQDASANPVSGVVVTAALSGCSAPSTLSGTTSITTNASGVAAFSDLVITLVTPPGPVTCSLTFTAPGLTSATSITITVN